MNVLAKRLAATGALLIGAAGLTACGVTETVQETVEEVSATTTLIKGVPTTSTPVFHYTIKGGVSPFSGVVDAPNKAITSDFVQDIEEGGFTLTMKFLVVGKQAWAKISFGGAPAGSGLPKLPRKWMKLDSGKLSAGSSEDLTYNGESDPGYVSTLIESATGLKETGKGVYAGTTDLTRATEAEIVDDATLKALGEQAKAVPLELALDSEGRITKAVVKIPAAGKVKAGTYEVVYDRYGTAAPVKAPIDVVAAPAAAYELLNG
ncbi:hypothetical protein AB0G04_31770 [Actinoplanes sp. NPDC023801]|uniref:hypothetical protein n=1 Tax=Actinoplanes sp. NPDC023801 TaxID=3154595 RepID=UPI00340168FD